MFAFFAFKNSAPNSASAADAATNFSIVQRVKIAPLRRMGSLACGVHPRNKYPTALMHASLSEKEDAYECTLSIMSNT